MELKNPTPLLLRTRHSDGYRAQRSRACSARPARLVSPDDAGYNPPPIL